MCARVREREAYMRRCKIGERLRIHTMETIIRFAKVVALLLVHVIGAGNSYAQTSVKHGPSKSLMGIEVHFRFDRSELDLGYMGNSRSFDRFAQVIDSLGIYAIDSVVIVSQSSPEGVYEHNVKLSRRRAATMRRAIEERHPGLGDRLFVHPDGESWERLRQYVVNDKKMKRSTIERVLAVIDDTSISIGTKKWRMEQLPVYRYLLQTYYPRIRNSVFCIIYFDALTDLPVAALPDPMELSEECPQQLSELPLYVEVERDPVLNVRTNMLFDAATVLNVGLECYLPGHRWTLLADYTFPWWSHDKSHHYLQMLNGSVEARRYFAKTANHTGHYLSAYGHANLYDFSFNAEDAWQGEGWGAGLAYGYVWQPWQSRRWKLEAFIRFGYYQTLYDPYHASDPYNGKYYYDWEGMPEDFISRNHRLRWFGPTGAGITISYDLIYKRIKKR